MVARATSSEGRLSAIFDNLKMITVILDPDGCITFCNDYLLNLTGRTRNEVLGANWFEMFVRAEHRDVVKEVFNQTLIGSEIAAHYENPIVAKDGSSYQIAWNNITLDDLENNTAVVASFGQDITAWWADRKALKESELKYRSLVEQCDAGFYYFNLTGESILINDQGAAFFGKAPQDYIGKNLTSFFEDSYSSIVMDRISKTALSPEPLKFEDVINIPGGERQIEFKYSRVLDAESKVSGVQVVAHDITNLKAIQVKMEENEELLQNIYDNSDVGIYVVDVLEDGEYRFTGINPAHERLLGVSNDKLEGKGLEVLGELFGPQMVDYVKKQYDACVQSEVTKYVETQMEIDGEDTWWLRGLKPVKDHKGRVNRIIATATPVTELRKAEQEKLNLEIQLKHAQKLEALGTLAGGIAHDFNNILAAIVGFSELALEDVTQNHSASQHIKQVLKAGDRAKELVTQILTFSRKIEPQLSLLDLNQIVEQTMKMLKRIIPRMVDIVLKLDDKLWLISADPSQISQIVMNLGTNANDAMPNGGTLTIETKNYTIDNETVRHNPDLIAGEFVLLTVSDNGTGMSPETLENIFDPFFTQKEVGQGTGLGLSTVYGIVKSHGGFIDCTSEEGEGTIFRIYLPVAQPIDQSLASRDGDDLEAQGGDETILMIDDEEQIRQLFKTNLTSRGYRVLLAGSGEEALEIFAKDRTEINLVLLDISMPGMGGYRCLQELLKIDPEVKVLISSGYSKDSQLENSLEVGAAGIITKPYSREDLLKMVRSILDK